MTAAKGWGYKPAEWWALPVDERRLLLAHARAEAEPLTSAQQRARAMRAKMQSRSRPR